MDIFPPGALTRSRRFPVRRRWAALDCCELFHVQADELAWPGALIAAGIGGLEQGETVEMMAPREPCGRLERKSAVWLAIWKLGSRCRRSARTTATCAGGVCLGLRPGGAIVQSRPSFASVTRNPLAHSALGETGLEGGRRRGELMLEDRLNDSKPVRRVC